MILGKRVKQPGETKFYDVTYEDWLAPGETLSGVTATAVCTTKSEDHALTVVSAVVASPAVRVTLAGGTAGQTYKVTMTLETSLGQIDEDEFIVAVRDY